MYLCLCKGITERAVRRLGQAGPVSAPGLLLALGLDDDHCCGRCAREIDEFVALAEEEAAAPSYRGRVAVGA